MVVALDQVVRDHHDRPPQVAVGAADQLAIRVVDVITLVARGKQACSSRDGSGRRIPLDRPHLPGEFGGRDHVDPGDPHQKHVRWDRAGIQQQLRAYGGRHNGETDRENRASLDRLERTTEDVCFLVSILQVREQVVSFYVSFPESALNASIALIVSIPRHASMDGLSLLSSSGRDH